VRKPKKGRSPKSSPKNSLDRRAFLKSAAVGAAVLAANPTGSRAQQLETRNAPPPPMPPEAEIGTPAKLEVLTESRSGSDFMVDVIKSLGIEYVCSNPGSSFRGLHESLINYGGNKNPEFITCCHEESSAAMAHGYFKIEGKPLAILAHGTVGLQHASMAIYNAWCDRVPVYIVVGNILDATKRIGPVEWAHSVQDAAAMVRDYVKWDDAPASLPHFAESAVRAYKIAMTPPTLPVLLVADAELQENPIADNLALHIPKLGAFAPPEGDSAAIAEAARMLVNAHNPVILADRLARTPAGIKNLVDLAESLQAPVISRPGRMNFPSRHPLNQTGRANFLIREADILLGLEMSDFWGNVNSFRDQMRRTSEPLIKPGTKLISINADDLYTKSNYQDFDRLPEVDLAIAADGESTLPALTEAVKRLMTDDQRRACEQRGAQLAKARQQILERDREAAAVAWDASPISTARLCAEIWNQVKDRYWSLVSTTVFQSDWPQRLWNMDKHYHYIGTQGGYGIGYGAPAAVGAALANRKYGRLSVNIQCDGDLMYAPGVLWTAAHHQIPLLSVMHNNRGYHQEVMQVQIMADRRNRGIDRANIGTTITAPYVEYAKLAQSMGMYGEGPISDPKDLAPALKRALDVVNRGEPAVVDVLTQPR
jgi:acetolactate synthase-1/2/3 large subunit